MVEVNVGEDHPVNTIGRHAGRSQRSQYARHGRIRSGIHNGRLASVDDQVNRGDAGTPVACIDGEYAIGMGCYMLHSAVSPRYSSLIRSIVRVDHFS
jgi:hypothetical protein